MHRATNRFLADQVFYNAPSSVFRTLGAPLIYLQRIYNFLLFHAIILPVWMFMGFTLHFYTIFGTNLLTVGPPCIAVFLPISVFRRKGISNGVQME